MKLFKAKKIFFSGIGGIGISAIARILNENKISIKGSDISKSALTDELEKEGIKVFDKHDESNLDEDTDIFIYTTAINQNNPEFLKAKKLKIESLTYAQALGEMSKNFKLIAISGTHGKTTTTALTSNIFLNSDLDPTIIIGTLMKELKNKNYKSGKGDFMLIEACEYKEAFLNYDPYILIITNVEADHLDYFKTEENYINAYKKLADKMSKNSFIIYNADDKNTLKAIKDSKAIKIPAQNYNTAPNVPGSFNIKNANQALEVAKILNLDFEEAKASIKKYSGSWRRFEIHKTKLPKTLFIDDFAHHPTEINETLKALKEKYPNFKILAVFQPHTYSRTRELLKDFGKSFKYADNVLITNIFEARDSEEDKKAVSAKILVDEINKNENKAIDGESFENSVEFIKKNHLKWDLIVTMGGSGNVDEIYDFI
jgi:UDP-N-acetylmuramate--alanine ligase